MTVLASLFPVQKDKISQMHETKKAEQEDE